jgi:hypothetical protein
MPKMREADDEATETCTALAPRTRAARRDNDGDCGGGGGVLLALGAVECLSLGSRCQLSALWLIRADGFIVATGSM